MQLIRSESCAGERPMTGAETTRSFVARIWLESAAEGRMIWRGHVRHVQGIEECHFQNLARLRRFLEETVGQPMPDEEQEDEDDT